MELLFLWVKDQNQHFFSETGFNFSPEFDFRMNRDPVNRERWILSENPNWKNKHNIFADQNIENVTAVVGKNGSGKTTLLSAIMKMQDTAYYEIGQKNCLYILKMRGEIVIFGNFLLGLDNRTPYRMANIFEYADSKKLYPFYMTNSQYSNILM